MNLAQQIVFVVTVASMAIFVVYTIARFNVNEKIMKSITEKMVAKVDHFDTIIRLLDCRIAAMGDRIDRMENREEE